MVTGTLISKSDKSIIVHKCMHSLLLLGNRPETRSNGVNDLLVECPDGVPLVRNNSL